jgi:hypothetical protein
LSRSASRWSTPGQHDIADLVAKGLAVTADAADYP